MSTEPPASTAEFRASTGFVGRRQELGALRSALEEALSGQGRLVMLVGEPGIGKTRTAQELAAYAETQGTEVVWGRCYEEEGTPPYWPWVQIIRSYLQLWEREQLPSVMGPGAADIAEIVPQVGEKLTDLQPPPALEPEQARFRLFDSITTFLKNAAQTQPLMLVLDDLHWADQASLLLLEFLAREMHSSPLLVVGTYRDVEVSRQHPLSDTLAQLAREPVLQRVMLRGLSQEDTESFIEMMAGRRPTQRLAETIYTHTEGNPFFMTEVTRSLLEQGELASDAMDESESIRIPEGVREVIGRRLNHLSEQCNQALTTAAIVGRQFGFKLLQALDLGMSEEQLLGAMDAALSAHLLEELPGSAEGYQFSHSLIQETLANQLSAARRVRLHARIGEALEEMYGDQVEAHAGELAHHFAQAAPVLGHQKQVRYSLLAGEQALATHALEQALEYFSQGLEAKAGQPSSSGGGVLQHTLAGPAADAETAALLFGLGRAQASIRDQSHIAQAVANLRRALDYYIEAGDVARAVAVAQAAPHIVTGYRAGVPKLITRALALVPPDSREAGYLLARYGEVMARVEGNYEDAQETFGRALAIARDQGDVPLEMSVLAESAITDFAHLRNQDCLEKSLRIIELARVAAEPVAEVIAAFYAGLIWWYVGDLEESRRHAAASLALAERLRDRYWLASAFAVNESIACAEGDWPTARTFSDRGLALAGAPREAQLLGTRINAEYQSGEFSQGEIYLERLLAVMRRTPPGPSVAYTVPAAVIPMVARITGLLDRLDIAEVAARTVLSAPSAIPFPTFQARSGLALLATLRSDVAAAREQYAALESKRGQMLPASVSMAVDHLLGLLSLTMGKPEQAMLHFEDALAFCHKSGYRPELAWTCYDYADLLLSRRSPGDWQKAISLLEEALAISTDLGMRPLRERVATLQAHAQSLPVKAPAYPDGLTQREVEVLRLIARGWSDREIAEELILSTRTVNAHVRNILNKTAVANRTEAASYAAHQRLT